ncbi:MAG: VapC toxin family PIN domain ribonuclease [Rhizobium sp. 63-7]|nr:MAG: VapC toxin family PIN domain ribonuclease [Rhizobium sp. 63-7]
MIVVDSSVWIAYFRAMDTASTRFLRMSGQEHLIVVGDLVLLELLQGARDDQHARFIEARLRRFSIQPMVDADLAVAAARNYRLLREKGLTIRKTIDLIIGTYCIRNGYGLLHDDGDFSAMAQHLALRIVTP